ncbi:hypothetical protein BX616_008236 [Lobosporangium transversale]|nr:hypothetical protein BX616_008236 [Lobosporangium transversale]
MSRNPYFAHLPTWRNRQDLAYALDNLPRILETMTASSPLLATYCCPSIPSTQISSGSSSSTSSSLSPSSATASTPSPSSPSPYGFLLNSTVLPSAGRASPSTFRERFMLDVAKECSRSDQKFSACPSPSAKCDSRRISDNVSQSQRQKHPYPQNNQCSNNSSNTIYQQQHCAADCSHDQSSSSYYPLQFSTRAKAMAFLIEILQSLQKEPCGCDLTKGCYCGVDGVEDHEGKSPCYVCGEWFPDRPESLHGDITANQHGKGQQNTGLSSRQGRSWHEQGSLRHHVAESRVKKWLDSVWKPPLTPATTPEQGNVKQFGSRLKSQDQNQDKENCIHQGQQWQLDYQQAAPFQLAPSHRSVEEQQQHQQHMDSARPWSFHDIEYEARCKSRSRQNSFSSTSTSYHYGNPSMHQQKPLLAQDIPGLGYNHEQFGSGSSTWRFVPSPKPTRVNAAASLPLHYHHHHHHHHQSYIMQQSLYCSSPNSDDPLPSTPSALARTLTSRVEVIYQPRTRTQSCSDSQQGNIPSAYVALTPPVARPNSCNSSRKPRTSAIATTLHNGSTTFAIPQEILDPNYKSPTFRIKSWNPPVLSSPINVASMASPTSTTLKDSACETPTLLSSVNDQILKSASSTASSDLKWFSSASVEKQQQRQPKQTLDEWVASKACETVTKTSLLCADDNEDSGGLENCRRRSPLGDNNDNDALDDRSMMMMMSAPKGTQQANTREQMSLRDAGQRGREEGERDEKEVCQSTKKTSMQFSFTSQRFRAAVQASLEKDAAESKRSKASASSHFCEEDLDHRYISKIIVSSPVSKAKNKEPTTTAITAAVGSHSFGIGATVTPSTCELSASSMDKLKPTSLQQQQQQQPFMNELNVVMMQKEYKCSLQDGSDSIAMPAIEPVAALASKLSNMDTSPLGHYDQYDEEIQKSELISTPTLQPSQVPTIAAATNNKRQHNIRTKWSLSDSLLVSSKSSNPGSTMKNTSSNFRYTAADKGIDNTFDCERRTAFEGLSGNGVGVGEESNSMSKVASWISLQRLMRKISKTNETMKAPDTE